MTDTVEITRVEAVVRALATAGRSLRLYPSSSPIPQQSVEAAISAVEAHLSSNPTLALAIAREGLTWQGTVIGKHTPGALELADSLRGHGIAQIDFLPGVTNADVMAFLAANAEDPVRSHKAGGLSALLAAAGVDSIRVVDVQLTVIDSSVLAPGEDEDFDEFLRDLAQDGEKLSVWLSVAAKGDPVVFAEGLGELERVSGAEGRDRMLESLAAAFLGQEQDAKDVLLNLAMQDSGTVRGLAAGMFRYLGSGEIAGTVLEGCLGRNMLSLSNALTRLPLEQVTATVRAEVQAMLPGAGHTPKEAAFLEHMLEVRELTAPEPSLVDADSTYRAVAQAATVRDEDVERARTAVNSSGTALNAAGVRTMLALLDQQRDFELYCSGTENLASMVPRLIELGDLKLAATVLSELSRREVETTGPWPELSERLRTSIAQAVGPRAMSALLTAVASDRSLAPDARDIMRHAGDSAGACLIAEAIALKAEGIEVAEELVGRRVVDLLNGAALTAEWYQLAPIVSRIAREGDARSAATIDALLRRPDEPSRREVVSAMAANGGPLALRALSAALRDPSAEVAIVAARALGTSSMPGAANAVSTRLFELDIDQGDFALGKELIIALSRMPEAEATAALQRLTTRKSLIKRGHFAEVQGLAAQALTARKGGQ